MTRLRCTRCGNRLRIRSRQCRHCGAREDPVPHERERSWLRRLGVGAGILAVLLVLALVGKRTVEPAVVADWYAEIAIQHLPAPFSNFAPSETSRGAFYYCIRRVVKNHMDPGSVATFPSMDPSNTVALGEGRYRVNTYVVEATEEGEQFQRAFTCTTVYERGRWVLEQMAVDGPGDAVTRKALRR
jgi:hypothetical protein